MIFCCLRSAVLSSCINTEIIIDDLMVTGVVFSWILLHTNSLVQGRLKRPSVLTVSIANQILYYTCKTEGGRLELGEMIALKRLLYRQKLSVCMGWKIAWFLHYLKWMVDVFGSNEVAAAWIHWLTYAVRDSRVNWTRCHTVVVCMWLAHLSDGQLLLFQSIKRTDGAVSSSCPAVKQPCRRSWVRRGR